MASIVEPGGPRTLKLSVDDNGDRTYEATFLVNVDPEMEGPKEALDCDDIPQPGDTWSDVGIGADDSATCLQNADVKPHEEKEGEPCTVYAIKRTFSTKANSSACNNQQTENPLLTPRKVSGSFTKFTEEAKLDRFGRPITTSAHELMRGPQVEFDADRQEVRIEQVVPDLQLPLLSQMCDTLNKYTLWGYPPRTIKFVPGPWEELYYGQCLCYYKRTLTFEIRYRRVEGIDTDGSGTGTSHAVYAGDVETFDRKLLDEGTKVLRGRWDKNPHSQFYRAYRVASSIDPGGTYSDRHGSDFIRFKDWNGENARVILDGYGLPADTTIVWDSLVGSGSHFTGTGTDATSNGAGYVLVEKYGESDLLLLDIPAEIGVCPHG